jgi:peptidoglycan/xylan/chitin deacetylase (PgdA/CDA1 family)
MYADDLKAEFDALYAEAGTRPRMMSVSAHDRIAGRPSRARVLEEFIVYAQSHSGVTSCERMRLRALHWSAPSPCMKAFNCGVATPAKLLS